MLPGTGASTGVLPAKETYLHNLTESRRGPSTQGEVPELYLGGKHEGAPVLTTMSVGV